VLSFFFFFFLPFINRVFFRIFLVDKKLVDEFAFKVKNQKLRGFWNV